MTGHPIDTAALSKRAGHILFAEGPEQPAATAHETCVLLDLLAAAEHRATRAEAERDEWREASAKLAASSNQANADLYEAETRIERLENRAETETARADEWRRKHRVMAGKRDAAHRAYVEEREERRVAEARIKGVEDVLDRWQIDGYDSLLRRIRRALDGDA